MNHPQRCLSVLAVCIASAVGMPADAVAQTADARAIQELKKQLEDNLVLIEQLRGRMAELEKRVATPSAASAAPAATEQRLEQVEQGLRSLASGSGNAGSTDSGVPLHGFLDVGYTRFNKEADGQRSGSRVGTFDLYLTPQLGTNVRSLIEIAFEYNQFGGLGIDAERLQIGYVISDDLVLWAGRFHTPYGYWNTAFHHGAQIQTSITRPRFLAFEDQGGILPSHSVGGWATGKLKTGSGRISYDFFVANGNKIENGVLDYNAGGDNNRSPSMGFNLGFSPKSVEGLTVGLHGLRQTVAGSNADQSASGAVKAQFWGGYVFYDNDLVELIGEYYRFNNRDQADGGLRHSSWAGYMQAGYKFADRLTGYARYEKAALSAADPYFSLQQSGSSYRQSTLGLRYDVDPRTALKLQVDENKDVSNPLGTVRAMRVQYAVRF